MNTADRAHNYARAFYDAAFDGWLNSLAGVARTLEGNRALMQQLQTEGAPFKERQAALEAVLPSDMDSLVRNLLSVLLEREDIDLLPAVIASLRERLRQTETGPVTVEVTTATPLPADQRTALEARLVAQYGPGLAYTYHVDPAILGGVIVRVGDKLMDGSVASRLAAMRQTLGVTGQE